MDQFKTDNNDYQEFVKSSSFHHEAIDRMFDPINQILELHYKNMYDNADFTLIKAARKRLKLVKLLMGRAYAVMGLCGEAGEVADKMKKLIRDSDGEMTSGRQEGIIKELGDVEWYLTETADLFDSSKDEVIRTNFEKLTSRQERGTRGGDGDDR